MSSSKIHHLSSSAQLGTLTRSHSYTLIDFHAPWCGPCKVIGPVFESLALIHAKPGKLAFAKCDTDANADMARRFEISAMPTFVLLKGEQVADSLRGADPAALRRLVLDAAGRADRLPGAGFSGKGNVLGSGPAAEAATATTTKTTTTTTIGTGPGNAADGAGPSGARNASTRTAGGRTARHQEPLSFGAVLARSVRQLVNPFLQRGGDSWYIAVIRFLVLYLTTLLSLDPVASAQASPYRVAGS